MIQNHCTIIFNWILKITIIQNNNWEKNILSIFFFLKEKYPKNYTMNIKRSINYKKDKEWTWPSKQQFNWNQIKFTSSIHIFSNYCFNFLILVNHVLYSQTNSLGDAILVIVEEPYRDWNSHYFVTKRIIITPHETNVYNLNLLFPLFFLLIQTKMWSEKRCSQLLHLWLYLICVLILFQDIHWC